MTDADGPIRVFVGSYDLSATDITIPADVLRAGDEAIAAERQRRREAAEAAGPGEPPKLLANRACGTGCAFG